MINKKFKKIFNKQQNLFDPDIKNENNLLLTDRGKPVSVITSSIISSIILKKKRLNFIILSIYKKNSWSYLTYKKFGLFKYINIADRILLIKNFNHLIISFIKALSIYLKWKDNLQDFINNFSINKIKIGHLIYDEYIKNEYKYLTFNKFNFNFLYFVIKKTFLFYKIEHIFKKNKIKILVCCSTDYATFAGLAARIAIRNKTPVVIGDGKFQIMKTEKDINSSLSRIDIDEFKIFYKKKKNINFKNFIKKRFTAKAKTLMTNNRDLSNANLKKIEIDRMNFIKRYGDNNIIKKIALFAPHAFTDANHGLGKKFLFKGYYDQFLSTVNFMANHQDNSILWVINPHPSSKFYGENGQVEEIVKKLNKTNLVLLPKNIKTLSAIKFSDLVITGRGTIGLEAASFGKKVIIAGTATYEKFGFTIEPKTRKEYFREIINPKNYLKQTSKNKIKALKCLYFLENHNRYFLPNNVILENLTKKKSIKTVMSTESLNQEEFINNNYYKKINTIIDNLT